MIISSLLLQTACSSSGSGYSRSATSYGGGYRGNIDGGGGIDHGGPIAAPLPEMGAPDMGGPGMNSMDMGFDW